MIQEIAPTTLATPHTPPGANAVPYAELRQYLYDQLLAESTRFYGTQDPVWIGHIADLWMDDENNSKVRYDDMARFLGHEIPREARILDMAAGCGTFVYHGLRRGLDVWGVDPEGWKHTFNRHKATLYGYPDAWRHRFLYGVGEALPFGDGAFEIVSSYQTIEHVQDVDRCLLEMLRVLKPGGLLFLRAPDYRGFFEGHYRLPWLPRFPRPAARWYLRLLGRPTAGLGTINYVTAPQVTRLLARHGARVVDVEWYEFQAKAARRLPAAPPGLVRLLFRGHQLARLTTRPRQELLMNLVIVKG